ncbi:hypothetical protein ABWED_2133 [Acinetobacter lwoffii]|nr:hypothetical protein ABEKA_2998 [Acinetobacter lwoffii]QZM13128.1 hypothetical protein ABVS_2489 [Acinetobacter lwoffii]UHT65417.1 hypothetical protein ABEDC_2236 [Acinetobacter lwoffii]UVB01398.1 hypothetical protein ABWED_2133 [Acinetobacter lwoffii]
MVTFLIIKNQSERYKALCCISTSNYFNGRAAGLKLYRVSKCRLVANTSRNCLSSRLKHSKFWDRSLNPVTRCYL